MQSEEGVEERWLGHVERVENVQIAQRVYVGECASSRSVGRPRKRWNEGLFKEKRFGCQASEDNDAG